MKNLAPDLVRQRVIIEGTTKEIVQPEQIKEYLDALAEVTGMEKLSGPYAYSAHDMGFGAGYTGRARGRLFIHTRLTCRFLRWTAIPVSPFLLVKQVSLLRSSLML